MNIQRDNCKGFYIVCLFIGLALITGLRFHEWRPHLLAGDDLWAYMLYHGDRVNNPYISPYFSDSMQRFRFVFSSLMRVEVMLFGKHLIGYFIVNVIVHAISGILLFKIAKAFCDQWAVAVTLSVLAVSNRFGLYEVTQITGQVENLSLMFCLASVLGVIRCDQTEGDTWPGRWKFAALLFAFLSFNAHERYVVLLPWLSLFFVLHRRAGTMQQRATFLFVCAGMVAFNVIVKVFVLKANLFQATGGVPLAINFKSIYDLSVDACASILGMNHGNAGLIGADWTGFTTPYRIASVTFAIISTVFLAVAFTARRKGTIYWPLALLVLMGLLLTAPVLTIRMEQRWELAPFFLMLAIVAIAMQKMLGREPWQVAAVMMLVGLVVSAGAIESRIIQSTSDIFFYTWSRFATEVKASIIDSNQSAPGTPIVLVTDPGNCSVILLYGAFFLIYEGKMRELSCITDPRAALPLGFRGRVYQEVAPYQLKDITGQ